MKQLQPAHPALIGKGRTLFIKQVKSPTKVSRLLQPATTNAKLGAGGKVISKGKWKGMPMYSLSLQERATCPTTCSQWRNCYGNNMPFANRIDHTSEGFLTLLSQEVQSLSTKHPGGFVIRLHVLGDFYSVKYVNFWASLLKKYSNLRCFGYTHRLPNTPIGRTIMALNTLGAYVRWSDQGGAMSANCPPKPGDIVCPEQTGKTAGCTTCGLCWASDKISIGFITH